MLGESRVSLPAPFPFGRLGELHWNIMAYETGRTLAHMLGYPTELVGQRIREFIAVGRAISSETYMWERAELTALRGTFYGAFAATDGFFWPATPGPAPEGIASTGEPKYIAPWTVLGGPIVTLPAGLSGDLPIGCILSSVPGSGRALGALARAPAD